MKTENLPTLKINKLLSKEQYKQAVLDGKIQQNELCLVPDTELAPVATSGDYNDLINKPVHKQLIATEYKDGCIELSFEEVV